VELLAALVGARVRVRVPVDGLEHPLGVLERHLLILLLVTLLDDLLHALPLSRRHVVTVWLLLLLLAKLLRNLLDFPTLFRIVVPRVVYRAPWTTLITTEGLPRQFVTMWAMAPTSRCSSSGSGSTSQ
jgi:hypothetical protein